MNLLIGLAGFGLLVVAGHRLITELNASYVPIYDVSGGLMGSSEEAESVPISTIVRLILWTLVFAGSLFVVVQALFA